MAQRKLRAALFMAAIALPGTAGQAADTPDFAAAFAAHEALPAPAGAAPGAVDIAALEPAVESATSLGSGVASFYADRFNGRRTASGETFSNAAMTAAHRSLPFGTRLRLTNPATGASVVVRVNDRGPFHAGRTLDVSRAAAAELGLIARGSGTVEIERL